MAKTTKSDKVTSVRVAFNSPKDITFALDNGYKVTIKGGTSHLAGQRGTTSAQAYGYTNVRLEDWQAITKKYNGMAIFKQGLIFAAGPAE